MEMTFERHNENGTEIIIDYEFEGEYYRGSLEIPEEFPVMGWEVITKLDYGLTRAERTSLIKKIYIHHEKLLKDARDL